MVTTKLFVRHIFSQNTSQIFIPKGQPGTEDSSAINILIQLSAIDEKHQTGGGDVLVNYLLLIF